MQEEVFMLTGKIRYLEIPTNDVETSAKFYAKIFGWKIRVRGDGQRAFDDATGGHSVLAMRMRPFATRWETYSGFTRRNK